MRAKHADTLELQAMGTYWRPLATRLSERVDASADPAACWPWLGSVGSAGYGQIKLGRGYERHRRVGAHVAAYMVANGLDGPPTLDVLHNCDTILCCNPAHLRLGTHAENMREMRDKGRWKPPISSGELYAEIRRLRALVVSLGGDPGPALRRNPG